MDIMDIAVPVALCIGAIVAAAILYSIVAAVKKRSAQRREEAALREHARRARPQTPGPGAHSRGRHAR